jgi:septal ring factor EnvC (AmiA/AmiB activator)
MAEPTEESDKNSDSFYKQLRDSILRQEQKTAELEDDIATTNTRLTKIEEQGISLQEGNRVLFAKMDTVVQAIAGMKAGTGRVSGNLILASVATFAPLIGAAAILGHVFMNQNVAALNKADEALRDMHAASYASLTDKWRDVQDQRETLVDTRIAIARLEEQGAAQEKLQALRDQMEDRRIQEIKAGIIQHTSKTTGTPNSSREL